jgi:hypothetical protein
MYQMGSWVTRLMKNLQYFDLGSARVCNLQSEIKTPPDASIHKILMLSIICPATKQPSNLATHISQLAVNIQYQTPDFLYPSAFSLPTPNYGIFPSS